MRVIFARDAFSPSSDVDVRDAFDRPAGAFQLLDVEERLDFILGRPVDLVTPLARSSRGCANGAWMRSSMPCRDAGAGPVADILDAMEGIAAVTLAVDAAAFAADPLVRDGVVWDLAVKAWRPERFPKPFDVASDRALREEGAPYAGLARRMGVSRSVAARIRGPSRSPPHR